MRILKAIALFWIILIQIVLAGCAGNSQGSDSVKVAGSGDLFYLGAIIKNASLTSGDIPDVQISHSMNAINDLKNGESDVVLLGREPTNDELKGLNDQVIAYDAVCIILDENSYWGGKYLGNGFPTKKTSGLRNLTTADLIALFSTPQGTPWYWDGDHYIRDPQLDRRSWIYAQDDLGWIKTPAAVLHPFNFPPGKFDTQAVIYQGLGLDEKSIIARNAGYTGKGFNLEEEIIAFEYKDSAYASSQASMQDFIFKLGFASRRVMTIAPQHVRVCVVSVDGIDPFESPQSIYEAEYKFSRKIHVLTRENSNPSTNKLLNFLESVEGQKLISDAGYLPVVNSG